MLASITGSLTSFVGDHGVYAVFALMLLSAVLPAASEIGDVTRTWDDGRDSRYRLAPPFQLASSMFFE